MNTLRFLIIDSNISNQQLRESCALDLYLTKLVEIVLPVPRGSLPKNQCQLMLNSSPTMVHNPWLLSSAVSCCNEAPSHVVSLFSSQIPEGWAGGSAKKSYQAVASLLADLFALFKLLNPYSNRSPLFSSQLWSFQGLYLFNSSLLIVIFESGR